jgi:hypothetical protein
MASTDVVQNFEPFLGRVSRTSIDSERTEPPLSETAGQRQLLSRSIGNLTEAAHARLNRPIHGVQTSSIVTQAFEQQAMFDGAEATVLSIDSASVLCEVSSLQGPMRVSLPREHFPETVHFGMPVAIAVRESAGVRVPVVTERQIGPRNGDLEAELTALVQNL